MTSEGGCLPYEAGSHYLIFFPTPAALSSQVCPSFSHDFLPQPLVGLRRGHVVDAGVVVLGVVPIEVTGERGGGLVVVPEAAGIFRRPFHRAERRFDERVVVGVRGRANHWGRPWSSHSRRIGLAFIGRLRSLMISGRWSSGRSRMF